MNVGKLFSVSFYTSSPWLIGSGGSGNSLALWDLSNEEAVQKRFADRVDPSHQIQNNDDLDEINEAKEKDFEAMMATNDSIMEKSRQEASALKKGKNKKKNKRKAHKRRG